MAKVLIVDDEKSIRLTLAEFLREEGHQVLSAACVTDAKKLIRENDFDAIVTDIYMPDGSGVELLAEVENNGRDASVVLITGEPTLDTAVKAVRQGAFDYLTKPVTRNDITRILRTIETISRLENEKEELHQHLYQSRRMESIGFLAGGIAHNFNNSLQVVLGLIENLLEDVGPKSNMYEDLKVMQRVSRQMNDWVKDLLEFAQRPALAREVFDVVSVVKQVSSLANHLIHEDIELISRIDNETLHVMGNPTEIQQALLHLVKNAAEAVGEEGTIELSVDRWEATEPSSEPTVYARIIVEDDGEGMAADVLDRIFDPFFSTRFIGRGMGLPIVFKIIKEHGGKVEAFSEPSGGTKIVVYLPLTDEKVDAPGNASGNEN